MMVLGMTGPGREHTTYRVRGEHANHLAIPTRFTCNIPQHTHFPLLFVSIEKLYV